MLAFLKKHREMVLYLFFGGCTTVVSLGSFILFEDFLQIHELVANVLSWILAVGFAYVTNRKWVFEAKKKFCLAEIIAFYGGRVFTLGVEMLILLVFVTWLDFNSTLVKLFAQVVVLIGNYLISKFLIFRKNKRCVD